MAAVSGARRSELGDALRACRSAFIGVGIMSCMINLLYLTGSIFMLEVYDRVLPSRSVPTLVGLAILAGGLYIAQGVLDLIRGRILIRIGTALDETLNARVFETVVRLPLLVGGRNEGLQPLRDLDNVRSFLSSMGPGAFFDLPWLPFYLAICFAFHVMIGLTALVGAFILVTLTIVTEFMSRGRARRDRQGHAHDAAVGGARRRRLPRDSSGSHRRHHHRGLDPERAGAGAGRSRDRALEGFCRRPPELAPPQPAARAAARAGRADAAAGSVKTSLGRGGQHRAAGRSEDDRAGRHLHAGGRQRPWRDRSERIGQILAGAGAGRRLAAVARQSAARWRGPRSMVVRCARPSHRLSAAGCRTVRGLRRPEHLPFRY